MENEQRHYEMKLFPLIHTTLHLDDDFVKEVYKRNSFCFTTGDRKFKALVLTGAYNHMEKAYFETYRMISLSCEFEWRQSNDNLGMQVGGIRTTVHMRPGCSREIGRAHV